MKFVTNQNGLKALVNDEGKIISPWLKGFVEGVGLLANPPQSNYFIGIDTRGKQAIYDKDGNQISDEFDYISSEGLASGQSQYYIGRKNVAGFVYERIYDKDKKPISPRFDKILPEGLVTGTRDFYIGKENMLDHAGVMYSLMDKNGVNVLGRPVKGIDANDFLKGKSNTFTFNASGLLSSSNKIFIMEYDKTEDNQHRFMIKGYQLPSYSASSTMRGTVGEVAKGIRQAFEDLTSDFLSVVKSLKSLVSARDTSKVLYQRASDIYLNRLVGKRPPALEAGQTYSLVKTNDGKVMLADKNGEIVSRAFKSIEGGVLNGRSPYYIATRDDGKQAIFDVRTGKQVSEWHKEIYPHSGVTDGRSLFYLATRDDGKQAIFYIDDPKRPISDWHGVILSHGLVSGASPYYEYGDYSRMQGCYVYNIKDIAGNKLLDRDYRTVEALDFLIGNSTVVAVDTAQKGVSDAAFDRKLKPNMERIDLSDKVEQLKQASGQSEARDVVNETHLTPNL